MRGVWVCSWCGAADSYAELRLRVGNSARGRVRGGGRTSQLRSILVSEYCDTAAMLLLLSTVETKTQSYISAQRDALCIRHEMCSITPGQAMLARPQGNGELVAQGKQCRGALAGGLWGKRVWSSGC